MIADLLHEARHQLDHLVVAEVLQRGRLAGGEGLDEEAHGLVVGVGAEAVLQQRGAESLLDARGVEAVGASAAQRGDDLLLLRRRRQEGGDRLERSDGAIAHQRLEVAGGRIRPAQHFIQRFPLGHVHHEIE